MVKFFGLFCCVVVAALIVGVHGDCLSITPTVIGVPRPKRELSAAFAEAYSDAFAQLAEGSCSQQEAESVVKASATDKAVAQAVLEVFKYEFVKWERDPECVGDDQAGASAQATAQGCAGAHTANIAQVLVPTYFQMEQIFGEANSVAAAFEPVFVEIFSEPTVIGPGDVDLDFDSAKQETVVTAIAKIFAQAVATYKSPEGKSYCPL